MRRTRSNPGNITQTVGVIDSKRRKLIRSENDINKEIENESPKATDEIADLHTQQTNDGNIAKEVTIDSMPSVSECTMKLPSVFGSADTARCEEEKEKLARKKKHIESCVKTQSMKCIKEKCYGDKKFATKVEDKHMIMMNACFDEPSMIPVDGYKSKHEFVKKHTPMAKKCMSQLRRNSQLLAKQHHLGECDSCL